MDQAPNQQRTADVEDAPLDLREYWRVILKHKWTVALVTSAVVAAVGVWTLRQPRIYEASASVVVDLNPPQVLQNVQEVVDIGSGSTWLTKDYFNTQSKIILSRQLGLRVVDKLGLRYDPEFTGTPGASPAAGEDNREEVADAADILRGKIRVDPPKDSRILLISVRDTSAKRAALYANAVAEAYIEQNLDHKIEGTKSAVDWLTDQLSGLKTKLERSEMALYHYKKENDILSASLEDRQSITSQRLVALNDTLTRVLTRRVELEARRAQAEELKLNKDAEMEVEAFPLVAQSSTVQNLKLRYMDELQQYAELVERYGVLHPTLIRARERRDKARDNLRAEIEKILRGTEAEYREVQETEKNLAQLIDHVKREAFEVNKREMDYAKLKREVENNQRLYDLVLKRQKDADLTGLNRANNIRILDPARVPTYAVSPNVRSNLVFALFLGLMAGIGLAFLFEFLDNTVKTQEDVEKRLGVPFLGIIPSILSEEQQKPGEGTRTKDLFIHTNPKSSVAECCRSIRTNLLFMSPDKPLRRLLVTSSGPQEGKTTTAIQLAIAMAQSGSRVLLLDTDMRRPRVHRSFGVSNERGLSTLILNEATLDDVVKTTEVPNLWVLPCGPVPPNPAELLHAERFLQVIRELDERYDRVIYDSPPVGAVADGVILATHVDGVVLVIKSGKTSKEMAKAARQTLVDVKARILGALLNDLDLENREYGYYYYYYYRQYGSYYGEKKDTA